MSQTEKRDNVLRFALLSITGIVSTPCFKQNKFCGLKRPFYTSLNSLNKKYICWSFILIRDKIFLKCEKKSSIHRERFNFLNV